MNTIPQYCQKCRERNNLGEPTCRRCGTRLMLVVFPQSLKYDTNHVPTYYEDHLLERVTSLELRLSQVTERLAATLELMLRQTKSAHSDHLLLETLIESLNTLGAIEKENLTKHWQKRMLEDEIRDTAKQRREKLIGKILKAHSGEKIELFEHLVSEGIKLFSESQEKQGYRTLDRALAISPANSPLLLFISDNLFRADKFEQSKIYLEKALSAAPQNRKVKVLLAVILTNEGDFSAAKDLLDSLPAKKNTVFCANFMRGMIAAAEGDWAQSLASFKEILTVRNKPETHYLTACVYFQLGRNKMALRHLQKAVEEDSGFADAWFMLSAIYEKENNQEKARRAIENAWLAGEAGAQCLEFLNGKKNDALLIALPFLKLLKSNNRILTGGSPRINKLFKEELEKVFE